MARLLSLSWLAQILPQPASFPHAEQPTFELLIFLGLLPSEATRQFWVLLSCIQERLHSYLMACSLRCLQRPRLHCRACQAVVTSLIKLEEERHCMSFSISDACVLWVHLHGEFIHKLTTAWELYRRSGRML